MIPKVLDIIYSFYFDYIISMSIDFRRHLFCQNPIAELFAIESWIITHTFAVSVIVAATAPHPRSRWRRKPRNGLLSTKHCYTKHCTVTQNTALLHKTLHGKASVAMPSYVTHKPDLRTRGSHPMKFLTIQSNCDEYKNSFWPRTIREWNKLPPAVMDINNTELFKTKLTM